MFLVLVLGVSDGGRAFYYRENVTNAARQALRVASTLKAAGNTACTGTTGLFPQAVTVSGHIPWQTGDSSALNSVAGAAAAESSGSTSQSVVANAQLQVTWHCSAAGTAMTNAAAGTITDPTNAGSAAIEVNVCYQFTFVTPLVGNLFGNRTCAGAGASSGVTIVTDVKGAADY